MPIKGLTDRGLALPEIGQIRKGAKKTAGGIGSDLTYFRVEFDETEKKTEADFRAAYGAQPAMIRIILPFNEVERMWDAWLEAYTAGRMVARSDGEYITYQLDDKSDVIVHNGIDKNGQRVKHPANNIAGRDQKGNPVKFKHTGRLKVIVPELSRAAYLTVMTTSIHDIGNISDQLSAFKELNGGQLAGIPFILRRRKKPISTPGEGGTRVRRVKSLISIEADPQWVSAKLTQLGAVALPNIEKVLLTANVPHDDEPLELDDDEIDGEYTEQEDQPEAQETRNAPSAAPIIARPYSPQQLKEKIADLTVQLANYPAKGTEAQTVAMNLNDCFGGNDDKRKAVLFYLTGKASASSIEVETLKALKKWINPTKTDSGWVMDSLSIKEAHAVYAEAMKEQGQLEFTEEK